MFNNFKKNHNILLLSLVYGLITFSLYFQPHYVHDSYRIYNFGFLQNLGGFWTQGRPISMWFNMLFNFLNISPRIGQIISIFLTILFLSISVVILYNLITRRTAKEQVKKTKINIPLFLIINGLFFNVYITEWMMFLESCIISLGCLLSILGAYCILEIKNEYKKYILSSLFFILGIFCYQASIALSGAIIIVLTISDNKEKKISLIVKKIILNMIPYILALISNFAFVKLINISNSSDVRLSGNIDILYNLLFSIKQIKWYFISMFNLPTKNIVALLIFFIFFYYLFLIIIKRENKLTFIYTTISIFSLWLLSVLPILAMPSDSIYFMARSVPYVASMFPFLILCIFLFNERLFNSNRLAKILIILYTIIVTISIIKITSECLKNNMQDINIATLIQNKINEYETESNTTINNIILVPDSSISLTSPNINYYGDNTVRANLNDYSVKEIMFFVSKRYYNIYTENIEKKKEIFGDKEWDDFSIEQIKFNNDTMYLVIY